MNVLGKTQKLKAPPCCHGSQVSLLPGACCPKTEMDSKPIPSAIARSFVAFLLQMMMPCASASQCSPRVAHRPKGTRGLKAPPRCHEASGMQPGSPFVCTMSNGPLIENSPNSRSFVPAVVLPPQLPRSRSTVASSRWHRMATL